MPVKELASDVSARAEGTLAGFAAAAIGTASAEGIGFLSWPAPPRISAQLSDFWFYGASRRRELLGTGTAKAG